jgi:hypothetical protein
LLLWGVRLMLTAAGDVMRRLSIGDGTFRNLMENMGA